MKADKKNEKTWATPKRKAIKEARRTAMSRQYVSLMEIFAAHTDALETTRTAMTTMVIEMGKTGLALLELNDARHAIRELAKRLAVHNGQHSAAVAQNKTGIWVFIPEEAAAFAQLSINRTRDADPVTPEQRRQEMVILQAVAATWTEHQS